LVQAFRSSLGGYTDTQTAWWSHKPNFHFLKKVGWKELLIILQESVSDL
jgi:hypothetical protein